MNLLGADDNRGKNIYIAKYKAGGKYFFVPWDLDAIYGILFEGSRFNMTNELLSNGLYDRLKYDCSPGGFMEKLNQRWNELRSAGVISYETLMSMLLSNYYYLEANGVYTRENSTWWDYSFNEEELSYLSDWIATRIENLDLKFAEDCVSYPADNLIKVDLVKIYPSSTSDLVFITSDLLDEYNVSIFNGRGQLVLKEAFHRDSGHYISLRHLESGIYFVLVEHRGHYESHKIVINK